MRRVRWLLTMVLVGAAAVPVQAGEVTPEKTIREAEARIELGDLEGALEALDAGLARLPADERSVIWEQDLAGLGVHAVLMGARHVYVLAHVHSWTRHPFLEVKGGGPLRDSDMGYDFEGSATCLDAATGRPLWHRRTAGGWWAVVDPQTDDLFFGRTHLVRLEADTGEEKKRTPLGDDWRNVGGLLVNGRPLLRRAHLGRSAPAVPASARLYDVRTGRVESPDLARRAGLSPDESRIVSRERRAVVVRDQGSELELWRHTAPVDSVHFPIWHEGDLLWRTGRHDGPSTVLRLNGTNGAVRWRSVLLRGAWDARRVELPGNRRPSIEWEVAGPLAGLIHVVEGDGAIHFLDLATGRRVSSVQPVRRPLAPPLASGRLLVAAGATRVCGVPLAPALAGRTPGEMRVRVLRAKVLLRLGRPDDALAEARRVTNEARLAPEAWLARADLAVQAGEADDALAARCRAMALAGATTSDALRSSHGLLGRLPIGGDVTAPLLSLPDRLVLGTRGGRLMHVDPRTLSVWRDDHVPQGIVWLRHRHSVEGGATSRDAPSLWTDAVREPEPTRTPREWFTQAGWDGTAVRDGARWIRPLGGGGVRVLDDETVVEYPCVLPAAKIRTWNLHLRPGPALGFGTGGVYRLDEHHRPCEVLVRYERASTATMRPIVPLLVSDGETVGLLVQHGRGASLEIRTLDGALLASTEVGPPGYIERAFSRLRPLAGGYLFVGDRIVYLRAGDEQRTWRFDPAGPSGDAVPLTCFVHTAFFTAPVLREGRLFVGCRDGGLYAFDVERIVH